MVQTVEIGEHLEPLLELDALVAEELIPKKRHEGILQRRGIPDNKHRVMPATVDVFVYPIV